MIQYQVQHGDTIAKVTRQLNTGWEALRRRNPHAVGRSLKTGHWFLKEGATIQVDEPFQSVLQRVTRSAYPKTAMAASDPAEHTLEYTLQPGDTLWDLAINRFHVNVADIMQDNHIVNPRKLRAGQRIRIRVPAGQAPQEVVASWYGEKYHGRPMANGKAYDMYASTIAHKDLPLGTRVELKNPATGQTATAVVTDRGPFVPGRDVDLSYGLAQKLSLVKKGVGRLFMRVL